MGIVERVRALAAEKGETIASVERACSFGQGSIRKWDSAAPSADKLYKVAQMFGVTMEYLLMGGPRSCECKEDADAITRISDDALEVAALWDRLDKPGQAIVLGDIYRRLEAAQSEEDRDAGRPFREAR